MAYRHFDSEAVLGWVEEATTAAALHDPRHHALTAEERQIVRIARHDATATLRQPGRLVRGARWLIGYQPSNRLANARWEALRRFAVLRRIHGDALPECEVERLTAAGYSPSAIPEIDRLLRDVPTNPKSSGLRASAVAAFATSSLFFLTRWATA